jgi:Arc/MetJ-type ribon-helix-helix transcriptional regulator
MSEMRFVAARVRIDILSRLDELIDQDVFENRSHAIRVALRELIAEKEADTKLVSDSKSPALSRVDPLEELLRNVPRSKP